MLQQVTKPTLIVDEAKSRRNIKRMSEKANNSSAILRPHFKTHQSAQIGEWFLDAGISKCTVSSVDMTKYFADAGWKDITIAFPYNPRESKEIEKLANGIKLNVLITSKYSLDHLNAHVKAPLGYYIKIDVGTHRTGVLPSQIDEIQAIAKSENQNHKLEGLLAHAGHSYKPLTMEEAKKIYDEAIGDMLEVKALIGQSHLKLSYGDTPVCSLLESFPEVDELRPGNFVFYDVMQVHFNSCGIDQIAVCMACPVVSVHPDRNEAVVFGGAVHLSKDFISENDKRTFGWVVQLSDDGWSSVPIARVDRLSQEHGIISGSPDFINSLKPGDLVGILPVHSCLTADLQGYYLSLNGEKLSKLNRSI